MFLDKILDCTYVYSYRFQNYAIFAFTLQDNFQELDESFRNTKRIKWNFAPEITSMHIDHLEKVLIPFLEENYVIEHREDWRTNCAWLPKEKAKTIEYEQVS